MKFRQSISRIEQKPNAHRGYTLIELIIAVGLFAIIMTLASGSYLIMISANDQAQAIATGINSLSFALESITRDIRTGSQYDCNGGDCTGGASSFSFMNNSGIPVMYSFSGGILYRTTNGGTPVPLTDPSITVTSLTFYAYDTASLSQGNYGQSRVTIVVSAKVAAGSNKPPISFSVETGATMRGSDL